MATEIAKTGEAAATAQGDVLTLNDVLSSMPVDGADAAGAFITFETVGGSTVICIDADGAGPAAPVPVITLANITGKTLQDLLNDMSL